MDYDKLLELGKLHTTIRGSIRNMITGSFINDSYESELTTYDIRMAIEQLILDAGYNPAFPVGIAVNHEVAHWCPQMADNVKLNKADVITIDFGLIDGQSGSMVDSAFTMSPNRSYDWLLYFNRQLTYEGCRQIRIDARISEIGKAIDELVSSFSPPVDMKCNLNVLTDLCGHNILPYVIHGGVAVPNTYIPRYSARIEANTLYAVEPFLSTGSGKIRYVSDKCNHYMIDTSSSACHEAMVALAGPYNELDPEVKLLKRLYERNGSLCFTAKSYPLLEKLCNGGAIKRFPLIVECDNDAMVSQFEHNVFTRTDGQLPTIITAGNDW